VPSLAGQWKQVERVALRRRVSPLALVMLKMLFYMNGFGFALKAARRWPVEGGKGK
jgi:hypothetical protein